MALGSTLYRLPLSLSDVDRGVYEELDVRAALHPSETLEHLALRLLAFALHYEPGIRFSPGGVSSGDEPPLGVLDPSGKPELWIEVGLAPLDRLRRAARLAARVVLLGTRELEPLCAEAAAAPTGTDRRIELERIEPSFAAALAQSLSSSPRAPRWQLTRSDGSLYLDTGGAAYASALERRPLRAEPSRR